jgi:hypothetical protein
VPLKILFIFALLPGSPCPDIIDQEAHALVVLRVEPEHPLEYGLNGFELIQPPKTETVTVHASQKRTIVNKTPVKHTVKIFTEKQLSDS